MKIVFINRYFYPDHSATSQMLSDLVFYLGGMNHEVHVITSRQLYEDPKADLEKKENINGVTVHRIWTSRFGREFIIGRFFDYLTFYINTIFHLLLLTNKHHIVVAKTDPPMFSIITSIVCQPRAIKTVNWIQDLFPEIVMQYQTTAAKKILYKILIKIRNKSLESANLNVAICEDMKAKLTGEGISPHKLDVIHNWADGNVIKPSGDNSLEVNWGLDNKFVIAYSGNLGRVHEIKTVVDSAKELQQHQDIVFLFIGGGSLYNHLKEVVASEKLSNFIFKPYQPRQNLGETLALGNIHLMTLREEMTGLVMPSKFYGIIAAGKPVIFIGSNDSDIAANIINNKIGWVIKPNDSKTLVNTILELKNDSDVLSRMQTNARALYDQKYTMEKALNTWQEKLTGLNANE